MKKSFVLLFALFSTLALSAQYRIDWDGHRGGSRENSRRDRTENLSRNEAVTTRNQIINDWMSQKAESLRLNERRMAIRQDGLTMRYIYKTYGQEPSDGRSLYISMHGGGGTTHEINNQQWDNQVGLYKPAEGIYLAPRAPWDAWDMWFQRPIDPMFEELIQTMVVLHNVNPDKVYLMGYSAGGDGVWRLAPRLADHWAAASMMAGHPGDVGLLNVRNLPFTIWCGAHDAAYNRNTEVEKRGRELDALQRNDPDGYEHECHIVQGKSHWMDLVDAAAVPWMARHKRNPYPKYIIWQQEEVCHPYFYWLKVPQNECQRGKRIEAEVKGNNITLRYSDYKQVTFYLNDQLVNLDKEVKVFYKGRSIYRGKLNRTSDNLRQSLLERGDPSYCFPAQLTVRL